MPLIQPLSEETNCTPTTTVKLSGSAASRGTTSSSQIPYGSALTLDGGHAWADGMTIPPSHPAVSSTDVAAAILHPVARPRRSRSVRDDDLIVNRRIDISAPLASANS